MRRYGQLLLASALVWASGGGVAWAEVVDRTYSNTASATVTSTATMTVNPKLISTNGSALTIAFGSVPAGPTPWVVAPQYLEVAHASNFNNWAIRFYSDNKVPKPTTVGKVLGDNGTLCDPLLPASPNCVDDPLGYGGLIGTTPANPNDRATLAWQVYQNPVSGGPVTPIDEIVNFEPDGTTPHVDANEVGGYFNAPWAYLADKSDCPSTPTIPLNCKASPAPTVSLTTEFLRVAQGDSSNSFLLNHPQVAPRTSDGIMAVYVAARLGQAPADTYASLLKMDLYHF